jgi:hypothetical protein
MITDQDHFDRARDYQEYYDNALREVGIRIPAPVLGETADYYRRETLHALQQALLRNHQATPTQPSLQGVNFRTLPNDDTLKNFETQALKACVAERKNPANVPPGEIKPIKVRDDYGRIKHTEYIGGLLPNGEQTTFIHQVGRVGRRVVAFMRPLTDTIQMFNSPRGK